MVRRVVAFTAALMVAALGMVSAHEGHAHKVMGTVKAVHADVNHVELTLQDGKEGGFYVTPATKYVQGKKSLTLADLKVGERVVVEGTMEKDKLTATKVQVGTAAAAAPAHKH